MSSSVTENKSLHIAASCWRFIDIARDCYDRSIVPSTAIYPHLHRTLQLCQKIVFYRLCTNEEKVVKTAYM